ncbi:Capsule polysaccharide export protein [Chitinispirillum alkaliphilum]|nr:Capsule polysaccharide export protein [Chitinispirillum alkaliphilum]
MREREREYQRMSRQRDTSLPAWETDHFIPESLTVKQENDTLQQEDTTDTLAKEPDSLQLEHFGYNLFTKTPEAFKPSPVGPVDPGYTVGPGDALRLSVWGQTEFQSELTVSPEGKIFIPVAGQVHVAGVPFEQLEQNLKTLLSRHYSGLSTSPQRTFMHLTVARLRPIRVFVMGEVKQPGGYTVSSSANVFNVLYSVGGPKQSGSLRSISVVRNDSIISNVDIYEYLLTGRSGSDVRLRNNDVIFIPPRGKTIAVTGSVFRPAYYELKPGENFQDLLRFSGGIKSASNIERAHVRRILPFNQRGESGEMARVIDLNLKKHLEEGSEFALYDQDSLHFTPLFDDLRNYVKLTGAVQYPGTYQSDDMTLRDLVFRFGRTIDNRTLTSRADLIRLNDDRISTTVHPVNLERLLTDDSYNRLMQPGDEVIVYEIDVVESTERIITVEGEVRNPGEFLIDANMTVADAILRAGGFTSRALKNRVDVFRPDGGGPNTLARVHQITLPDSLNYTDERGREFLLQDRDRIVIRPDPNYAKENIVSVSGLVRYAGTYALEERNDRLSDILTRAGGVMPDAFLEGASVTRRGQRVVVDFESAFIEGRRREDIVLHHGDSIYIPPRPNHVMVHGEVNNEGLYGFVKGRRLNQYIDRAGGLSDSAQYALVTLPNGETNKHRLRRFSGNPRIPDGSEIYITKKPPKAPQPERTGPSIAEVIKDTLAIITSAVTIIVLVEGLRD